MKNRTIKFRVYLREWDERGKMFYDCVPQGDFDTWLIAFDGREKGYDGDFVFGKDIDLMQFTGLYDKNGKEIYEGDVVAYENGNYQPDDGSSPMLLGEVHFAEGMFVVRGAGALWIETNETASCEVIGNIYEHPHLLTPPPPDHRTVKEPNR
jgi:uncharacterized phage protein (TIGR01671 family)